jgi:hypothetical protein
MMDEFTKDKFFEAVEEAVRDAIEEGEDQWFIRGDVAENLAALVNGSIEEVFIQFLGEDE